MNRHFLEFWGKVLVQAAQGQKQLEDLAGLMQRGVLGFPDFMQLFKSTYGLEGAQEGGPDYLTLWKQAEQDFRESFKDYLNLLGVVSREEYADLARKCERLEEKVAEQKETIKHLRGLLDEKGMGMEAAMVEFQTLIQKQGDQFQKFLKGLGESLKSEK
jgi:uncharacterized coiled-coil protein SlyX